MTAINLYGLTFYVFILVFSNALNSSQVSRIQAYYKKGSTIVKIQSSDYFGSDDLSSKENIEVGEQWQQIRDMHNILLLGGWENIKYFELKSNLQIKITILLGQTEKIYGKKYYGIYLVTERNKELRKDFMEYGTSYFKNEVLDRLKRHSNQKRTPCRHPLFYI